MLHYHAHVISVDPINAGDYKGQAKANLTVSLNWQSQVGGELSPVIDIDGTLQYDNMLTELVIDLTDHYAYIGELAIRRSALIGSLLLIETDATFVHKFLARKSSNQRSIIRRTRAGGRKIYYFQPGYKILNWGVPSVAPSVECSTSFLEELCAV